MKKPSRPTREWGATATKPWTQARRAAMEKKIDKAARKAAEALGAECAVVTVFFPEGEMYHMQTAGQTPMPYADLFERLAAMYRGRGIIRPDQVNGDDGGEDESGILN